MVLAFGKLRLKEMTSRARITQSCYSGLETGLVVRPTLIPFIIVLSIFIIPLSAGAQIDSLENRLQQAAALIRDNRIVDAERQLNSILKVAPKEARAMNLLGTIRAAQGRLREAETLFTQAISLDNRLIGAHLNLAYLYLLKGTPDKTISQLKEALTLDPDNLEASYKLARLLLSQDHVDECVRFIEKSKRRGPQADALLVTLGDAYLRKGDGDKAEENYLAALGKQQWAADALIGLALVSQLRGNAAAASMYLSRAKSLVAGSPDLLYRFAVAALKSGIYEEARSALEQAINLNPDEPAYHIALGATWLKKPDLFEAEQAFRRALQLHSDSSQAQMYLGYSLLKQKKYAEARAHLEKSIQAPPNIPEPFYYLGLIAQEQGEDERAVEILEKVVQQFPEFANARIALGSSYIKLKNYARARQELEMAVKLNPDEPKAHYNLAMLYARLKDAKRAQEEMRIVERLKSSGEQTKENDALTPPPTTPR